MTVAEETGRGVVASGPPASIDGFATRIETIAVGGRVLRLVLVDGLESSLDRDRLLCDEDYTPPYWALVWSGARVLVERLAERADLRGRTVLDVGAGLGLTSIAAARLGGRVTAVDREATPMEFLRASATLNGVEVEVLVGDLDHVLSGRRYDVVVAAELLYEVAAFEALAAALTGAVAPGGVLWIADARRVDTAGFFDAVERRGFAVRDEITCDVREESTLIRVRLAAFAAREPR